MPTITSEEAANNVWVVTPSGRVDAALAPGLEAALESQLGKGNAFLVVDFASVSYVASSGLKALLSARRKIKQAGGELALAGLSPEVFGILEMIGLHRLFPLYASRSEAVAVLSALV